MENVVLGHGPKTATVMIIGERPGAEEIKLGRPFVGRSGQFLTEELEKIGIKRDELYITNVVKTFADGNKPPTKHELKNFLPILEKEIREVRPKIIILLGNTATKVFLPECSTVKRCEPKEIKGVLYFPMPHPGSVIRGYKKPKEVWERAIEKLKLLT
ncbi:MAG: uracil-DNA glycosylase [DPANN group archaeon]|nr:uracil-DNA glycosylase [DPANN group archaeon]